MDKYKTWHADRVWGGGGSGGAGKGGVGLNMHVFADGLSLHCTVTGLFYNSDQPPTENHQNIGCARMLTHMTPLSPRPPPPQASGLYQLKQRGIEQLTTPATAQGPQGEDRKDGLSHGTMGCLGMKSNFKRANERFISLCHLPWLSLLSRRRVGDAAGGSRGQEEGASLKFGVSFYNNGNPPREICHSFPITQWFMGRGSIWWVGNWTWYSFSPSLTLYCT